MHQQLQCNLLTEGIYLQHLGPIQTSYTEIHYAAEL